jgi:hypothetical protein
MLLTRLVPPRAWPAGLAALLFATAAPAQPPAVSVNFTATSGPNPGANLAPTDVAGFIPLANWNNVDGNNITASNLLSSSGQTTGVTVAVSGSPNTWSIPANQLPNSPNGVMMQGYVDTTATSTTTVSVTGLTAAGFTGTYHVFVYAVGDANNGRAGDYTIGSQAYRLLDDQQFNGTFRQVTQPPSAGFAGQSGNFMDFSGLTGDGFNLTAVAAQDVNGFRAPINAIQIVADPVPEPGLVLLACAAAAGGLAAWRRRSGARAPRRRWA